MTKIMYFFLFLFSFNSWALDEFNAHITFTKFKRKDVAKVEKAAELIKEIVLSQSFRDKILNFSYQGKKQFLNNLGLSNEQIYQKILEGSETLNPEIDFEMDLDLELYFSFSSTIGHTYPDVLTIWLNKKYFRHYTPAEVAGNLFHEWLHKLGFYHDFSYSPSRDFSVPYAIGYIVEDFAKERLEAQSE